MHSNHAAHTCNFLYAWVVGLMFVGGLTGMASATLITKTYTSDSDLPDIGFQESIVAEGRIGDRGGRATFEQKLWPNTNTSGNEAQFNWENDVPVYFSVTYNANADEVIFTLDTQSLTYAIDLGTDANTLKLFARTTKNDADVALESLALNGQALPSLLAENKSLAGLVVHSDLSDGFSLTGTARMQWDKNPPRNSHLLFQIKPGVSASPIPEPGIMLLLGLGGAGLLLRRRAHPSRTHR